LDPFLEFSFPIEEIVSESSLSQRAHNDPVMVCVKPALSTM
jgi:hypothetical protein